MEAYKVVKEFEETIAEWSGSKYAIAVESCCSAIFLSLLYLKQYEPCNYVKLTKWTYPGVAMSIINAGYKLYFTDEKWKGVYRLTPQPIVDSALTFKRGMYIKDTLYCLSFHYKKALPIGRGGMVLTDDRNALEWLKMARFDGRREGVPLNKDNATICGWNMYMTPEQASRGLTLFQNIKDTTFRVKDQNYPDLSKWRCFR